jgi:hypothetical protein
LQKPFNLDVLSQLNVVGMVAMGMVHI